MALHARGGAHHRLRGEQLRQWGPGAPQPHQSISKTKSCATGDGGRLIGTCAGYCTAASWKSERFGDAGSMSGRCGRRHALGTPSNATCLKHNGRREVARGRAQTWNNGTVRARLSGGPATIGGGREIVFLAICPAMKLVLRAGGGSPCGFPLAGNAGALRAGPRAGAAVAPPVLKSPMLRLWAEGGRCLPAEDA